MAAALSIPRERERGRACAGGQLVSRGQPGIQQWGIIGDSISDLARERVAGVTMKVVRLSWRQLEPSDGRFSTEYLAAKRAEICALDAGGMRVVLDSGLQDTPQWIHRLPDSYLVNQYGRPWTTSTVPGQSVDDADADLIFNPRLRAIAARYFAFVGRTLGPDIAAIRIGGGQNNELQYPPASTPGHPNTYWAFGPLAQRESPVPGWKPGDPSPDGQAAAFLSWYWNSLTNYEQWQINAVRTNYRGPILVLYPGWGIRPGQYNAAVADDLDGRSTAEINTEVQRAHDFSQQVAAIHRTGVWAETTWLDAPFGNDDSADPAEWTPVHYLATLVRANPLHPLLWGENTGHGDLQSLITSVQRARSFGLTGLIWFNEPELLSGGFVTLAQYAFAKKAISGRMGTECTFELQRCVGSSG